MEIIKEVGAIFCRCTAWFEIFRGEGDITCVGNI